MSTPIADAARAVRAKDGRRARLVMILGSGLGSLADTATQSTVIPGSAIPGYPEAGVGGHKGDLVIGELAGLDVVFVRGRFHAYEGHDIETLTFPIRLAAELGARELIVTNAAGSLRREVPAGSIMRITDHLNMTRLNPLLAAGPPDPHQASVRGGHSQPYDRKLGRLADQLALDLGIKLSHGVYCWTLGPSYETPAEIRYFRRVGADAVGMSTVPEVTVATRLGMRVLGFSAITNLGAGLEEVELSHGDVLEVGRSIHDRMQRLLLAIAGSMSDRG